MHFIDEAKIFLKSGDGGAGCLSFRREKFIEHGGPDGGDGGRGGNITIRATKHLNTLIDFRYKQHFKAKTGDHGMGRNRYGKAGEDMLIEVPVGTQIFSEDGDVLLYDMTEENQEILIAKGGDGGFGNAYFKSSINQAPRRVITGFPGQEMWVWLKLKLLCDVGLVGLPNAGKSTFLSSVTAAKPKIADYPFTTLKPQLGVVYIDDHEFVIADLPGLIEGASEGLGLGHRFLKHVERCRVVLHLIDITSEDIIGAYKLIRQELSNFSEDILEKREIIALTKSDLIFDQNEIDRIKKEMEQATGKEVMILSSATNTGTTAILRELNKIVYNIDQEEKF